MSVKSKSLISIVVPNYNRNDLIPDLILNIIAQEYRPIEVIIVDDGSDELYRHSEEDHDGITVLVLPLPHSGRPGLVRNAGIQAAHGEFIAFLDSDDLWVPQKLRLQMEVFEKNPLIDFCHGNALIFKNGVTHKKLYNDIPTGYQVNYDELLRENMVLTSSVIAKKTVFTSELFDKYSSAQDYEMWLRLVRKFKFYFLDEPLYVYAHSRPDSVSRNKIRRYLNLLRIFKGQLPFCVEKKRQKMLCWKIAMYYFKLAKFTFLQGNTGRCRSLLRKSLQSKVTIYAMAALVMLSLDPRLLGWLYARNQEY